jgi:WD40 repeat protein
MVLFRCYSCLTIVALAVVPVHSFAQETAEKRDKNAKPVWSYEFKGDLKLPSHVIWVGFSPDGAHLAARAERRDREGGIIRVWNLETKKEAKSWKTGRPTLYAGPVCCFTSNDLLLTAFEKGAFLKPIRDEKTLKSWIIKSKLLGVWPTREGKEFFSIECIEFDPLGVLPGPLPMKLVWCPIPTKPTTELRRQEVEIKTVDDDSYLHAFAVNNQGTLLASVYRTPRRDTTLTLDAIELNDESFRLKRQTEQARAHLGRVSSLLFSPDGKMLASGSEDGMIRIWDTTKPPAKGWSSTAAIQCSKFTVSCIAFRPDGKYLAFGTSDNRRFFAGVIDVKRGNLAFTINTKHNVNAVAFSPDGRYLATGTFEGEVQLWDFNRIINGPDN